jgi:phosphoglucosamine mutase
MLQAEPVTAAVADWRDRLGSSGRILLRKSGTEPLIRVMVEAEDERLVETIVSDLCCIIEGASPLQIAA